MKLIGKRALITGGAGLIGSHIADLLVAEGVREIIVVDNFACGNRSNLEPAMASGLVKLAEGDIRNLVSLDHQRRGVGGVFHQAAVRIAQCAEQPRLALEVLANGSFNVFEAAHRNGVEKVVAASSASVTRFDRLFSRTVNFDDQARSTCPARRAASSAV